MTRTCQNIFNSYGHTGYIKLTGLPTNISDLCEYQWYGWVYYSDPTACFPYQSDTLGRCLGPTDTVGTTMTQWVLNQQGNVLPQSTLRKLTNAEQLSDVEREKRQILDEAIKQKLGNSINEPPEPLELKELDEIPDNRDDRINDNFGQPENLRDADSFDNYDKFINTQVTLPKNGEGNFQATVIRRARDKNGDPIGRANLNPVLDSHVYDIQFNDGTIQRLASTQIALNIFQSVDKYGNSYNTIEGICGHERTEEALSETDLNENNKHTTKGWKFKVKLYDGTIQWMSLADIKESAPIDVADYVKANNLES